MKNAKAVYILYLTAKTFSPMPWLIFIKYLTFNRVTSNLDWIRPKDCKNKRIVCGHDKIQQNFYLFGQIV